MNVQNFIKTNGWDALTKDLGITVKIYKEHGLRKLNYSQINSPKLHPVVIDCRGLLLDSDANVVSRTFRRFFNLGELESHKTADFLNVTVYEKCDGSLIQIFYCPQTTQWEMATRGSAFAEVSANFGLSTFREAVLGAMKISPDDFQKIGNEKLDKTLTYAFEFCGPSNRIVTRYSTDHLVLLAIVSNVEDFEYSHEKLEQVCQTLQNLNVNVRLPKTYNLKNVDDCKKALDELLEPTEEGFVVRHNITGDRIKLKSVKYVALHRLKGDNGSTFKRLAELVQLYEEDEYLTVFEEDKVKVGKIVEERDEVLAEMDLEYENVRKIENQKEFAIAIMHLEYKKVFFQARKEGTAIRKAFGEMRSDVFVALLAKRMGILNVNSLEF